MLIWLDKVFIDKWSCVDEQKLDDLYSENKIYSSINKNNRRVMGAFQNLRKYVLPALTTKDLMQTHLLSIALSIGLSCASTSPL